MRAWPRALLGALLVGAVAAAGIALNFTLLQLTQDAHDPVGKLSPRSVFANQPTTTTPTTTTTATTTVPTLTTGSGSGPAPGGSDGDSDD